jgi:hypothetical protein
MVLAHWVLILAKPYVRAVCCLLAKPAARALRHLVLAKPAMRALHDVKPSNSTFFFTDTQWVPALHPLSKNGKKIDN